MEPPAPGWGSAPSLVLELIFCCLSLKDRCKTVGSVCTWWRQVSLEAHLLPDLNLNCLPLFAQRTRNLPDFYQQRASFIAWLMKRAGTIKRLSLTAERWEDDSQAVYLRLAVAELVAARLQCLRLVCTDSGQATSAFLSGGECLRELQLDFWGRSNGLPRAMADCTALTRLTVQCSSGLDHYKVLASLKALQDLSVVDCDWQAVPQEVLGLPLARLHLRFADFGEGRWLPPGAARLAPTLRVLELPGCQISALPDELSQLSGLTRLVLDRNYIRELPPGLAHLRQLASLSCEGCSSLRELPASLAAALPLRSLNLLHTGVVRLPLAAGVRLLGSSANANMAPPGQHAAQEQEEDEESAAAAGASSYLRHLTELRWGAAEWEASAGGAAARRWVAASGAVVAGGLPDLSPLLQASGLAEVQLAHVPASEAAEAQVAALCRRLPRLRRLQVNSAVLLA